MHHSICTYFTYGLPTPIPDEPMLKSTLQHTATHCNTPDELPFKSTLQHTATTHCNTPDELAFKSTLQHTATIHCNTPDELAFKSTLQHTATTHCNTPDELAFKSHTVLLGSANVRRHSAYEWVMSRTRMSHVTYMNESCHVYDWIMLYLQRSAFSNIQQHSEWEPKRMISHLLHVWEFCASGRRRRGGGNECVKTSLCSIRARM